MVKVHHTVLLSATISRTRPKLRCKGEENVFIVPAVLVLYPLV